MPRNSAFDGNRHPIAPLLPQPGDIHNYAQQSLKFINVASIKIDPTAEAVYVKPTEIYTAKKKIISTGTDPLRISTGGAGQSGLIRALAEEFIFCRVVRHNYAPISVAWLASDTSASFNYLASRSADLSTTYHPVAEKIAIKQDIARRRV